ncbi:competence type IV pilus minor pilin ComGD [Thalassobacillus devorans]|uniref:competence type IV pilus minor pilin ComGD n=1 Tax=Thalassobacillus devorans TaxID=279813 RepID=UPI00048B4738|nr:competence type IV pilus minor pilin ComGD [Thalassobacillus devorans]
MLNRNGYTLLETMIVLLTLSVFLIIAVPIHHQTQAHISFTNFYKQFEDDVLLTQQLAMNNQSFYDLIIRPEQKKYFLMDAVKEQKIIERNIPHALTVELQTLQIPIRFSSDGTIYSPGSFRIKTPDKTYKVVFPFGKSRCYMYEI